MCHGIKKASHEIVFLHALYISLKFSCDNVKNDLLCTEDAAGGGYASLSTTVLLKCIYTENKLLQLYLPKCNSE